MSPSNFIFKTADIISSPTKINAGGGKSGNRKEYGREEEREYEHDGGYNCRQTGASAFGDTRAAFNITCNGRCTEDSSPTVPMASERRARPAREAYLLIKQVAFAGNSDKRADRVKQVNKEERKDNNHEIHYILCNITEIKFEECGATEGGTISSTPLKDGISE